MHPRLPIALGVLALLLSCAPAWQSDRVLGVTVEWPDGGARPIRAMSVTICEAADASPDPRLLDGARVVVLATAESVHSSCMNDRAAACWHPDYDDADGAGTIYVGPSGLAQEQLAVDALRHEFGHLARWRWLHDGDSEHEDHVWWARYDSPQECR
jgi:hypothetical protein